MKESYEILLRQSSILLAEDDKNVRESFKKVLLLYVDTVYEAKDGYQAYEFYKKYHPDILITDIKMPLLNGLELIKKIRSENSDIPIIVTSAFADQDFLLESIKLSLVEYVIKPIKGSDLTRLLEECATILMKKSQTIIMLDERSSYDYKNKIFTHHDESIPLTHKEIEFFELLLSHRGNLVTKRNIEDKLYIYEEAPPSALKNLVFKLRKKLGTDHIKTIGKLGYMIE
ncbi:response regulator transcription factor [Sulfurospirillum sp. 1612]|uniref:response regulator transcription factor n=1 Tax=Sulfurospirillum sp. 1612 TaxID=3094835 RepID=UPI002F93261C